jgi:hypothetical protein
MLLLILEFHFMVMSLEDQRMITREHAKKMPLPEYARV